MKSIELFAGAGGLALGTAAAGFEHDLVLEWNKDACRTIRTNQRRGFRELREWRLIEKDVRDFEFHGLKDVALVSGGPPCQPFSIGGKHNGSRDHRNLFPEVVRAVRETRPMAILIENVRGLLRPKFAKFFEYVLLQLMYPELMQKPNEAWQCHLDRLEQHHTNGRTKGLKYNVVFRCLNAADFGVPQRRHRVLIVGFRSDLNTSWSFPSPTHSQDALLHAQFVTGEYWDEHKVSKSRRTDIHESLRSRVAKLRTQLFAPSEERWKTVRDAIVDLPVPTGSSREEAMTILNHVFNPGARSYAGHTGSPLDEPAKTLKAGDHGVPGGENMLAMSNGSVRYFTVRESARLQTFPDDYFFEGSWTEAMRQIGNAVPVRLAEVVARSIFEKLS